MKEKSEVDLPPMSDRQTVNFRRLNELEAYVLSNYILKIGIYYIIVQKILKNHKKRPIEELKRQEKLKVFIKFA